MSECMAGPAIIMITAIKAAHVEYAEYPALI